jgi:hypothetical protein
MLILKNTVNKVTTVASFLIARLHLTAVSVLAILLAITQPSMAQDFELPSVDITGVDDDSTATEIVYAIIRYGFQFGLWIFVLIAGGVFIKNVVKAINKVRKDEDGKWGDVVGEIAGNAVVVILIIALATWVNGLLN